MWRVISRRVALIAAALAGITAWEPLAAQEPVDTTKKEPVVLEPLEVTAAREHAAPPPVATINLTGASPRAHSKRQSVRRVPPGGRGRGSRAGPGARVRLGRRGARIHLGSLGRRAAGGGRSAGESPDQRTRRRVFGLEFTAAGSGELAAADSRPCEPALRRLRAGGSRGGIHVG